MDDYLLGFEWGAEAFRDVGGVSEQRCAHVETCGSDDMRAGFNDALAFASFLFARSLT